MILACAEAWQLRLADFTSSTFPTHHHSHWGHHINYDFPDHLYHATIYVNFARGDLLRPRVHQKLHLSVSPARSQIREPRIPLYSRLAVLRQDFQLHPVPKPQGTTKRCCIAPVGYSLGVSLAPPVMRLSGHWFLAAALF